MPRSVPDAIMTEEESSMAGSHLSAISALSGGSQTAAAYYAGSVPPSGQYPFSTHQRFSSNASVTSTGSDISLKRDREREGRCSECGMQTHEFRLDPATRRPKKYPLTVEGEVHRGRCLLCHPIQQPNRWPESVSSPSVTPMATDGATVNTVSTAGANSGVAPEPVTSASSTASTVMSTSSQEALQVLSSESVDLCDVLAAMRRFPRHAAIQSRGCEKLWIQSWDDETSAAIGRVGGIATILQAMNSFLDDSRLQQCGCEALQNLALNDYNREVICENGGILTIVQAMERHQDVVGVQQCGCTAMANLAASTDSHVGIANTGGVHVIVRAAQRFCDEENVMRAAYQALRALGYNPGANQGQQQQQQQQQSQAQPEQASQAQEQPRSRPSSRGSSNSNGEQGVLRLDQHGFPIDRR